MGYTKIALEEKITDMYPEILGNDISVSLELNRQKKAYIVKFQKDSHELTTYLEQRDADECMDGIKCIHLGVQIGQFIKNFEERK